VIHLHKPLYPRDVKALGILRWKKVCWFWFSSVPVPLHLFVGISLALLLQLRLKHLLSALLMHACLSGVPWREFTILKPQYSLTSFIFSKIPLLKPLLLCFIPSQLPLFLAPYTQNCPPPLGTSWNHSSYNGKKASKLYVHERNSSWRETWILIKEFPMFSY
jgi:hypothetical protein